MTDLTEKNTPIGLFSVIGAGTIHPNSKYVVTVTAYETAKPFALKIFLNGNDYDCSQIVEVQTKSIKTLEFLLPDLKHDNYQLIVEEIGGNQFRKTEELSCMPKPPLILIQTDKASYKPGDLVRFRALFLDVRTRPVLPATAAAFKIILKDGEENLLKQWKSLQLKKGVFVQQFQLSEQPVLGHWTIEVHAAAQCVESKSFEVAKYVLPKFSVEIETAKDVAIADDLLSIKLRSHYTYGKGVKGQALVTVRKCDNYYEDTISIAEKTIEVIDGKGSAVFKFTDDLQLNKACDFLPKLEIIADMEEELTGCRQNTVANVQLHRERYKLEFLSVAQFVPGAKFTLKIAIKQWNGLPVQGNQSAVKLLVESYSAPAQRNEAHFELKESIADQLGIACFDMEYDNDINKVYYFRAEFQDVVKAFGPVQRPPLRNSELITLELLTENPKLGEAVEVYFKTYDKISYFMYAIISREQCVSTEIVMLEEDRTEHKLVFNPTFDMMPSAMLLVHYSMGKELRSKELKIDFEKELANKITIEAPLESQIGESIKLSLNTLPASYIGLMAVDQSVLLLKTGNDLSLDVIMERLDKYKSTTYCSGCFGAYFSYNTGFLAMTNADSPLYINKKKIKKRCIRRKKMQIDEENEGFDELCELPKGTDFRSATRKAVKSREDSAKIRKDFPETWFFDDFECEQSTFEVQKVIPDTITSWIITAFSLNSEEGLGLTKNPTTIKAFKTYFISTNLPYSVKRGENIRIPVTIFNYMNVAMETEVILFNNDKEFEFTEHGADATVYIEKIKVPPNEGGNVFFQIRPLEIGQILLKITAKSALAGDTMHKTLKVEPEGLTIYKNRDYFLHFEVGVPTIENSVKLDIPNDMVDKSEFIQVSIMGNVLGSTLSNIDNLVRMPYGCGEQNMINFVPNILVLWYLESMKENNSTIENKAKRFLEIGYQRELTYKHDDGSYSAFGKSDNSGSTWLTAYVMRSFHQAKKYTDISDIILEEGLNFLAKTQVANGSFQEVGQVLDFSHMNELGLTAFVLLAFLENHEQVDKHQAVIDRGFEYLQQNVRTTKDLYALSIALYALQQRKLPVVHELLAKLEALARIDGGHKWWTKEAVDKNPEQTWRSTSHDVEITGYILMTLLDMNVSVMPITKWLISQRNSNGGFSTTQETVVGLWALIKFAEKSVAANTNVSVELKTSADKLFSKKLYVNDENAMVVQSVQLPRHTRELTFVGSGAGAAILQISYQYNIMRNETEPSFKLNCALKPKEKLGLLSADIYVEFLSAMPEKSSNMTLVEVHMPSGYTARKESFDKIKSVKDVKRVETKNDDTVIIVYFDCLTMGEPRCIPFEAELTHEVTQQKPAAITVFDYYNTNRQAIVFYET